MPASAVSARPPLVLEDDHFKTDDEVCWQRKRRGREDRGRGVKKKSTAGEQFVVVNGWELSLVEATRCALRATPISRRATGGAWAWTEEREEQQWGPPAQT